MAKKEQVLIIDPPVELTFTGSIGVETMLFKYVMHRFSDHTPFTGFVERLGSFYLASLNN